MTPTFLELRDFIKGYNVIIKTALSEIAHYQGQQREEGLIELRRIVFEFLLKGNTFYSDMPEQYKAIFREELYDLMIMDKL